MMMITMIMKMMTTISMKMMATLSITLSNVTSNDVYNKGDGNENDDNNYGSSYNARSTDNAMDVYKND